MASNEQATAKQGTADGHTEKQKPVLIAVDGSEHADYAFHWYMEHIHQPNHYVILLHVPERYTFMVSPLGTTADIDTMVRAMQEEEAKEKALLEKLAHILKDGGVSGKVKSVTGKPGEVIVSVANDQKAIFIVCGSRGKGTLRRTFLGSISDYVLHHSYVPVIICKHKDLHTEHGSGSPSLKDRIMHSPLFRRKTKSSPGSSPKHSPQIQRKKSDAECEPK